MRTAGVSFPVMKMTGTELRPFVRLASTLCLTFAQVYVEKDAKRAAEIAEFFEGFRRWKQHAAVSVLPQQSPYAPQHRGVIIHDNNRFCFDAC